ncbi:hypothetical protein [Prescottella agglutinans]|uniref:ABC-type Fe3+ transport system permease subunit n=1 Tax=Prescottella agglutinans TaxID=1644129 RepID=A0ABT6M8T5_9NOCA|nr:hypothetical protein [Prescottella agglutinans]MDH6280726.1 ABC-type Fe3+ transport system permease subunit [Prescottella agglutinans]
MSKASTPAAGSTPASQNAGMPVWAKKAIWVAVIVAALVVVYFVLAAFLPRWWSQRVGSLSSGSFSLGITWGLLYGIVGTVIPLLLFYFAWRSRRREHARIWVIGSLVLGIIFAIPNLLTLTVVLGGSSAAHAGERTMDVDAPGFRGASLWGAIIGVLLFAAAVFLQRRYRKRGEEVTRLRNNLHQREPESPGESPAPEL